MSGPRDIVLATRNLRMAFGGLKVFDDLNFETRPYEKLEAYSIVKSANSLFAVELNRRMEPHGVIAFSVNPGPVFTAIQAAFTPEEMKRMADIFRGRIIDVTDKSYTIELTGDLSKNDAFLEAIERSAILETVRTGASGIGRGERILRV